MRSWLIIVCSILFISCSNNQGYLFLKYNKQDSCGYVNSKGDTIIPFGKYGRCFTDTFKKLAIVEKAGSGFVVIDRNEKALYNVFIFDNGPDDFSEGYFRIVKDGRIGYMDSTFSIKVQPKYGGAYPFKNGLAQVTDSCKTVTYGEHSVWVSDHWYYINKAGIRVKN